MEYSSHFPRKRLQAWKMELPLEDAIRLVSIPSMGRLRGHDFLDCPTLMPNGVAVVV